MTRLVLFLIAVLLIATGLAWLADRPGTLLVTWQGYEIETSVFRAIVIFVALIGLALLVIILSSGWWTLPLAILAAFAALVGTLVERWLFFAEATHTVTLYYGQQA